MLRITEAAQAAIHDLTLSMPEIDGLRLETRPGIALNGHGPTSVVDLAPVSEPPETDEVLEEGDAKVFLEPSLSAYLDDKVLDFEVDGEVGHFVLDQQEE